MIQFRHAHDTPIAVRDLVVPVRLAHGIIVHRAIAAGQRVPTDLIAAYEKAIAGDRADTPVATATPSDADTLRAELERLPRAELVVRAKHAGVNAAGTSEAIIGRIVDAVLADPE